MLEKTRKILDRVTLKSGITVLCFEQRSEENESLSAVYISRTDWVDMGRPETITMTIEPGDKLNNDVVLENDSSEGK
jgi:hypothetical protein